MSVNYLSEEQVIQQLSSGRSIEQWIGHKNETDYRLIKWLRIDREKTNEYSVTSFEVFDEGNFDFLDIYEFSPLEPDLPYGEITTFDTKEKALDFALKERSAKINEFVGKGIIQDVYAEFLRKEGLPPED
ncbi:MAG: hypothetical protein C0403_18085 [Desulfobacterium sp.]|nr:hypothetical protein [Desulfobacterium sp.]